MEYIISLITFFAGFIISELIRRSNRAETFNAQIFNKRLDMFCELYYLWNNTYEEIHTYIESIIEETFPANITPEEYHFQIVEPLLHLLDENSLFFSEELCVHCGASLMGPEDYSISSCKEYLTDLSETSKTVKEMIKNESGLTMLNKNIKTIIKYKHKSDIITYYNLIKKEKGFNTDKKRK